MTDLRTEHPELFAAAEMIRASAPDPSAVRLRCILGADGQVVAGKIPEPDPPHVIGIMLRPIEPPLPDPNPIQNRYRGKTR